jgi:hypothetical protein
MNTRSKSVPWYIVWRCFADGTKEEVCALKGNRYLALQEAFKQHRHDKDTVYIVRQQKYAHREMKEDATIATYGPHYPLAYVHNLD